MFSELLSLPGKYLQIIYVIMYLCLPSSTHCPHYLKTEGREICRLRVVHTHIQNIEGPEQFPIFQHLQYKSHCFSIVPVLSPVLILGNLQISCSILNTSVCKGLFFNDHGSWDKPFLSEMSAHEFLLQLILESRTQVAEEGFI